MHIQNIEPGPPKKIALAVPVMFPVPTRPPMAMERAWNALIPEPVFCVGNEHRIICRNKRICGNFRRIENSRPQPKEKITRGSPHTKLSTEIINSAIFISPATYLSEYNIFKLYL